jgi:NAD(P)-dependent dehydrogenase (short-subunit alcohol dehydrogenase family)
MTEGSIRFDEQVVVISGSGRGLGRSHALLFGRLGAHVLVNDLDADAAESTAADIRSAGGSALCVIGDVTIAAQDLVDAACSFWGGIDVLVNNAGTAHVEPFGPGAGASVERILREHVISAVNLTSAAWPTLVERGGRVVNTTSAAAFGLLHHTAYSAAKGALLGFTKSLALEALALNVKVNAILPMARTRMYEQAGGITGSDEDQMMTSLFPPDKVSPVVAWLGARNVPLNGELVEISAGTASRVQMSISTPQPVTTPESVGTILAADSSGEWHPFADLSELLTFKVTSLPR